jgi:hypothetical protein
MLQRMGLEAAHEDTVGLPRLPVDETAVKQLDDLASRFLHAGSRFARFAHGPATLDHVIEIKPGKLHRVDIILCGRSIMPVGRTRSKPGRPSRLLVTIRTVGKDEDRNFGSDYPSQ